MAESIAGVTGASGLTGQPPRAADAMAFSDSSALSLGVGLELQLVNTRDCDLTRAASDLLPVLERLSHPGDIKPEITESMIEISTGIHTSHDALLAELRAIRDPLVRGADRLNVLVTGGGAHPFQRWNERHIFDKPRFRHVSELYGYLAKQFTVFGQHVHLGCPDGDTALYLLHAFSRYVPHFIALAGSSPYYQGVDTAFESSRLSAVDAFPLSGRAPCVLRWDDFVAHFERMRAMGIVQSMKDFYWDIRPKPEFGTIELRVCDTPLTVETAAAIAAYAQALGSHLLAAPRVAVCEDLYLPYTYNRFQAARFGLQGELIDPGARTRTTIAEDILATLERLRPHARELDAGLGLAHIAGIVDSGNDARWLRQTYAASGSLSDMVFRQAGRWRGGLQAEGR